MGRCCRCGEREYGSSIAPRLLRSRREPQADHLRLDVLQNGNDAARTRILEHLHGRPIPESIANILPEFTEDSNPLIAQAARSLIADSNALETGA